MKLNGKTAVVTGAASGIGRATAETLAQAGAHVLLGDIAEEGGQAAAAAIRARAAADFIRLDVTDLDSIEAFRSEAYAKRAQVDIVANVAGWGKIEPFVENTPEFWRKVIDLNLIGPIAVTRAFLERHDRAPGRARSSRVASDAGRVGSLGETVYSGAKGGAIAFTKSLAREMARYNITVNCVCPGPTDTPLLAAVPEKHQEAFVTRHADAPAGASPRRSPTRCCSSPAAAPTSSPARCLSVSGGLTLAG